MNHEPPHLLVLLEQLVCELDRSKHERHQLVAYLEKLLHEEQQIVEFLEHYLHKHHHHHDTFPQVTQLTVTRH